jgi:hypothetical protein
MRIGFVAFSSALAFGRSPNPIAPPATAETLMKLLLVVNLIECGSMAAIFFWCNRTISSQQYVHSPL